MSVTFNKDIEPVAPDNSYDFLQEVDSEEPQQESGAVPIEVSNIDLDNLPESAAAILRKHHPFA